MLGIPAFPQEKVGNVENMLKKHLSNYHPENMFLSVFGVRVEQSMGQMSPNGNVSGKNLALVSSISVLYVPRSTYMGLTWINGILSSIMNEIPHNGYLGSYKGVTYHSLWHIC